MRLGGKEHSGTAERATQVRERRLKSPMPPDWLGVLGFDMAAIEQASCDGGAAPFVRQAGPWTLAMLRTNGRRWNDWDRIVTRVRDAYGQLRRLLASHGRRRPVRFWNHVPQLLHRVTSDADVYMGFNAARHQAFTQWFQGHDIAGYMVASSAVESPDGDFHLHALAYEGRATPLENPRQRPAYRYSKRYGPVPPSFARATLIEDESSSAPLLITAGTASVRGEDSVHVDDVIKQLDETEINLASLVAVAGEGDADCRWIERSSQARRRLNSRYEHVRAYIARAADEALVLRALRERFAQARSLEIMRADLCRPQLLVELEAMGRLGQGRLILRPITGIKSSKSQTPNLKQIRKRAEPGKTDSNPDSV